MPLWRYSATSLRTNDGSMHVIRRQKKHQWRLRIRSLLRETILPHSGTIFDSDGTFYSRYHDVYGKVLAICTIKVSEVGDYDKCM